MRTRSVNLAAIALCLFVLGFTARAEELKQARVTQIVREVKLLPNQAEPRDASVNDNVQQGTAVRTGVESRTELTFTDQTLARLGANTLFSFEEGTRSIDLGSGAILLRVPKGAGGAQIKTAAVTAAITGTTVLMEHHAGGYSKFIVLEGKAQLSLKGRPGETREVEAGEMLVVGPNTTSLPEVMSVDIGRIMETSVLITDFAPLASVPLIERQREAQEQEKAEGGYAEQQNAILPAAAGGAGGGALVSLVDAISVRAD
ncbi:MAG TPA: FecR domain-containing protein, partial [Chthoniobacterales bacterium]